LDGLAKSSASGGDLRELYCRLVCSNPSGYAFGFQGRRQVFATSIPALVITVVLAVIADLDRSRQGFLQVSQQPLIDLQRQLLTFKEHP